MKPIPSITTKFFGKAAVAVYPTDQAMGAAAATLAARFIRTAISERGYARVMVATGNSQRSLIENLVKNESVDWSRVTLFHMDEYVGITQNHPASFRHWLRSRVADPTHPQEMHYIEGDADAPQEEIKRYSELLATAPIDLAFVGFGENGHIAFNDPAVADFNDRARLKIVTLDERCRLQQVGEGHFKDLASVPAQAMTVTCSELLRARAWICCVPESRKAEAVCRALEGPISTACPASIVRTHPNAHVFLDAPSAARLSSG